jgi:predicted DNA-binding transcriptional regulator YafY
MNDAVVKDVDRIYKAINDDKQINFKYFHKTPDTRSPKKYTNDGRPRTVSPYALVWSNGNLYLYAYDGGEFKHYRIDRMENISNPLPFSREGEKEYSEKNIIARKVKVFNMYSGDECEVKIEFQNKSADAVIDEFGTINMMYVDASHFAIRARISLSPTFYAWVASLGDQAKIVEPTQAVEGMKEFLKKASKLYEDEGEM